MEELNRMLDAVIRGERARVVGALVRVLGSIDAAEEAFQEAVLAALSRWPLDGAPHNPAAWLTTTAKNQARDAARHRRIMSEKAPLLAEDEMIQPEPTDLVSDDELCLIFTCCHPVLTLETQVALTLKVVLGFSVEEIARAFLSPEKTVAQRITRAKSTIADSKIPYEVPARRELPERLASVLAVVYLIFNEGHTAREGALMRLDLQGEAFRLARLLCDLLPTEGEVFGLHALIAFSLARAATRTNARGDLLLLAEQERAGWDRPMITEGLMALEHARRCGGPENYVLQAEIAACHATSPTWEGTEWSKILRAYERLLALHSSPIVALNRTVAVCMSSGPAAALTALAELDEPLARYHLFYALRADYRRKLGEDAKDDYERALSLATNDAEREFLRRKIED